MMLYELLFEMPKKGTPKTEQYGNWLRNKIMKALRVHGELDMTSIRDHVFSKPPSFAKDVVLKKIQRNHVQDALFSLNRKDIVSFRQVRRKEDGKFIWMWKLNIPNYNPTMPMFVFTPKREKLSEELNNILKQEIYEIVVSSPKPLITSIISARLFEVIQEKNIQLPYELSKDLKYSLVKRLLASLEKEKKIESTTTSGFEPGSMVKGWAA